MVRKGPTLTSASPALVGMINTTCLALFILQQKEDFSCPHPKHFSTWLNNSNNGVYNTSELISFHPASHTNGELTRKVNEQGGVAGCIFSFCLIRDKTPLIPFSKTLLVFTKDVKHF